MSKFLLLPFLVISYLATPVLNIYASNDQLNTFNMELAKPSVVPMNPIALAISNNKLTPFLYFLDQTSRIRMGSLLLEFGNAFDLINEKNGLLGIPNNLTIQEKETTGLTETVLIACYYPNLYRIAVPAVRDKKIEITPLAKIYKGGGSFPSSSGDGGLYTNATLSAVDTAFDQDGNLFIVDVGQELGLPYNNRIRRIDAKSGIITTVAGNGSPMLSGNDGTAIKAGISPIAITIDKQNNIFIIDKAQIKEDEDVFKPATTIRRIDAKTGIITRYAGNEKKSKISSDGDNGPATEATFNNIKDIAVDANGNLLISDSNLIRQVNSQTGIITTIAGGGDQLEDEILATKAELGRLNKIVVDANNNLYVADVEHFKIRKMDLSTNIINTLAGGISNPIISGASFQNKKLQIQGTAFIQQNAKIKILINNKDVTKKLKTNSETELVLEGTAKTLGINKKSFDNVVTIFVGEGQSNKYNIFISPLPVL